jgi:phosphatidate phosphatase APP1
VHGGCKLTGARSWTSFLLPALVLVGLTGACDDNPAAIDEASSPAEGAATDGAAVIRVLLTDAPTDYIAAASVDIGIVELISADGEHVVLSEDGTDGFVNLLDLQGAATTPIAEADIDPGEFVQLRLVVEAAQVELADGYEFRDGSTVKDLMVPSGAQTGIKLNLHDAVSEGPLTIVPGETVLVLDFDVSRSFVILGNPKTPAGIRGMIFTPTIRVTGEDVAASISGTVGTSLSQVSVEGLTVRADPTDGGTVDGYQTQSGTTLTDADGNYTIHFLVPGTYDVTVEVPAGLGTEPESHSVSLGLAEDATGVDFDLIDVTGSISGTVSTELEDASIENLTVTATPEADGVEPFTATTDADGNYTIDSVLPGSYVVTVEVGDDELTDPAEAMVEVGRAEEVTGVDFEIVEDLTGSIAGTVTTSLEGVAVEGLTVTADPAADGAPSVTTTTDADGNYLFDSLPADTYTVTVAVGTGLTTDPESIDVELSEDEVAEDVDFEVIEAS